MQGIKKFMTVFVGIPVMSVICFFVLIAVTLVVSLKVLLVTARFLRWMMSSQAVVKPGHISEAASAFSKS